MDNLCTPLAEQEFAKVKETEKEKYGYKRGWHSARETSNKIVGRRKCSGKEGRNEKPQRKMEGASRSNRYRGECQMPQVCKKINK